MKLIMLSDVKKVGQRGTLVTVADGYANNVLIPKKLAVPATAENIKRYERAQEGMKQKEAMTASLAKAALDAIRGQVLTISARANEKDTLFQAVTGKQIIEAIETQLKVSIPEDAIRLGGAVKTLGAHTLKITLQGASAECTLEISKI